MWIDTLDDLADIRGNYSIFDFADYDVYEINQRLAHIKHPETNEEALVHIKYANGFPYFQVAQVLRDSKGYIINGEWFGHREDYETIPARLQGLPSYGK